MPDPHDEHYESIPWDALVTDDARRRRRWLYLAAGVVVALALGAAIGRSLPEGTSTPATSNTAVEQAAVSTVANPDLGEPVGPATRNTEEATAASYASWFVADYFTIDGSDVTRQSVLDRLPAGVELPEPDSDARSFVESVFPVSVEALGADRFRVVAIVRALAATDGESYRRQPARAVEVTVLIGEEGASVTDLPRPVALPSGPAVELEVEDADAPEVVLEAAEAEAAMWGEPVGSPQVSRVGEAWRVVHLVRDAEGLVWPVASWFDAEGTPVSQTG